MKTNLVRSVRKSNFLLKNCDTALSNEKEGVKKCQMKIDFLSSKTLQ